MELEPWDDEAAEISQHCWTTERFITTYKEEGSLSISRVCISWEREYHVEAENYLHTDTRVQEKASIADIHWRWAWEPQWITSLNGREKRKALRDSDGISSIC